MKVTFTDLFSGAVIALNRGSSTRRWIDEAIAASAQKPTQIFEAYQLTTSGSMVAAGLGVAVVPALCQRQMQPLGAVCRPITGSSIERRVGLFTLRRRPLSSAVQQMVKLLVTQTYQID